MQAILYDVDKGRKVNVKVGAADDLFVVVAHLLARKEL